MTPCLSTLAKRFDGCYRWRMTERPQPWDLPKLDAYVEATLRQMAKNRDVKTDRQGEPVYTVRNAGRKGDGSLRIDFIADLSGIGMPINAPLAVIAGQADPDRLAWFLGDTLIATTPDSHTPEQAGDALGMDQLLDAHRAWVGRSGGRRGR